MTKDQAAKLAQAYQWISEGKEVECQSHNKSWWQPWYGFNRDCLRFRLKDESLLECWANVYAGGAFRTYVTLQNAIDCATEDALRIGVPMREVRDEPTT